MTQPTPANLIGEWEQIINNVERHNARLRFEQKLRHRKMKKKIGKVIELSLGAILSVALGFAGLLAPWLAVAAAVLLVCAACFHGGRIYEATKQ